MSERYRLTTHRRSRITTEEAQAQRILDSCTLRFDEIERNLDHALNLAADCLEAYSRATDDIRRAFNRSFFEKIWVGEDGVEGVDLRLPFAHLLAHDLTERLEHETAALTDPTLATYRRQHPVDRTQRPRGALPWENKNRDLLFVGHGSNVSCLVGLTGQNANHVDASGPRSAGQGPGRHRDEASAEEPSAPWA